MYKILSIKEYYNEDPIIINEDEYIGYEVITKESTYYIVINNELLCCEKIGFATTNDDIKCFINKKILCIRGTDYDSNIDKTKRTYFVNIITCEGALQFTFYNEHNGNYGHDIVIFEKDNKTNEITIIDKTNI